MPRNLDVLVTGFLPFGNAATNPAGDIASSFKNEPVSALSATGGVMTWGTVRHLVVDVLWSGDGLWSADNVVNPQVDSGAADRIDAAILDSHPDIVISLGMAADAFVVEQLARDEDRAIGDNGAFAPREGRRQYAGEDPEGRRPTTLPRARIEAEWQKLGVRVGDSDDAGGYICNDVFYRVMRRAAIGGTMRKILRAGFIHVPAPSAGVPFERARLAIRNAIRATLADVRPEEYLSAADLGISDEPASPFREMI